MTSGAAGVSGQGVAMTDRVIARGVARRAATALPKGTRDENPPLARAARRKTAAMIADVAPLITAPGNGHPIIATTVVPHLVTAVAVRMTVVVRTRVTARPMTAAPLMVVARDRATTRGAQLAGHLILHGSGMAGIGGLVRMRARRAVRGRPGASRGFRRRLGLPLQSSSSSSSYS